MNEFLQWLKLKLQGLKSPDSQNIKNLADPDYEASTPDMRMMRDYMWNNRQSPSGMSDDFGYDRQKMMEIAQSLRQPVISKPGTSLQDLIRTQLENR